MTKFPNWSTHGLISYITVRISCLTRALLHNTIREHLTGLRNKNVLFSGFFTRDKTLTLVPAIFWHITPCRGGELIPTSLKTSLLTVLSHCDPTVTPLKCSPHYTASSHTSILSTFNANLSNPDSGIRL